jgi:cysteine desulfurase/selenocysteine lyase
MDAEILRASFPVLSRRVGSKELPLIYLDSAATSLMPSRVIDELSRYEQTSRANIHRGIHSLAEESTELFETAREELAAFLNASAQGLVFTCGTTGAINIVARGWRPLATTCPSPADCRPLVLVAEENHHANIVPWQMLAERGGCELRFLSLTEEGDFDEAGWYEALEQAPRLVALTHVSNVLGFELPARRRVAEAHEAGAAVLLDCAQSFGHMPLDLGDLDVDFAAASIHKAYGPLGLGFLYCKPERLAETAPLIGGGGMVARVTREGFSVAEGVAAFEGGTPNISAVVGMRAALSFLRDEGLEALARHTAALAQAAATGLAQIEGVSVLGPAKRPRTSLVSFTLDALHPHDLAAALDEEGIAVRAGHHCAMPLHLALGLPASLRASFAVYSLPRDVEALLRAVNAASERRGDARIYRKRR